MTLSFRVNISFEILSPMGLSAFRNMSNVTQVIGPIDLLCDIAIVRRKARLHGKASVALQQLGSFCSVATLDCNDK